MTNTNRISSLLMFLAMTYIYTSSSMAPSIVEKTKPDTLKAIIVPGVGGGGRHSFDLIINNEAEILRLKPLPRRQCDMGQRNCTNQLTEFIQQSDTMRPHNKILFFGSSQGTATLINWIADLTEEEQKRILFLCLEATVENGNNAILQTVDQCICPALSYLPFARFLLPLAAKTKLTAYNPYGRQAIRSVNRLSKDIPIILMHNVNDPEVSINSSRRLYCELRRNNHQKTYLIELEAEENHIGLLYHINYSDLTNVLSVVQKIYEQNNLPPAPARKIIDLNIGLELYQPSIEEVEKRIGTDPESKRFRIQKTIDLICACPPIGLGFLAHRLIKEQSR